MDEAHRLILEHLSKESQRLLNIQEVDWVRTPVSVEEFVREHLNLPPLTARQLNDLNMIFGSDPTKIFDNGSIYNIGCFLLGKGSGKDYLCSVAVCYCFYTLLCMRSPQAFLGFPSGEGVDIIVVSYSQEQTLLTTFDKIKQRMKNWHWLKRNYTVVEDEKIVSGKGKPIVQILKNRVVTWNNVRIFSEHSANESYEGYNVLFWVMSEASAFKTQNRERNGHKVFSTLRSSAASRFGTRWKGLVVSFPRYDQDTDFTFKLWQLATGQKKVEEGEEDEIKLSGASIWAVKGAPWEYKPWKVGNRVIYSGDTFEFEGRQIPVELEQEFADNPEECRMKYLCEPPPGGQQVFDEESIITAMHAKHDPLLTSTTTIDGNKIKLIVHGLKEKSRFLHSYLVTVDLGKVKSAAAVGIQHVEGGKYILDAIMTWTPDPRKKLVVDLTNVKYWLLEMAKAIPSIRIYFDQWQSELLKDELIELQMQAGTYHTYAHDYRTFKQGIQLGKVELLDRPDLAIQLNAIREKGDEVYVDPLISPRKDMVDVVVGGFKTLMSEDRPTNLPGTLISSNLSQFGMVIK